MFIVLLIYTMDESIYPVQLFLHRILIYFQRVMKEKDIDIGGFRPFSPNISSNYEPPKNK